MNVLIGLDFSYCWYVKACLTSFSDRSDNKNNVIGKMLSNENGTFL